MMVERQGARRRRCDIMNSSRKGRRRVSDVLMLIGKHKINLHCVYYCRTLAVSAVRVGAHESQIDLMMCWFSSSPVPRYVVVLSHINIGLLSAQCGVFLYVAAANVHTRQVGTIFVEVARCS